MDRGRITDRAEVADNSPRGVPSNQEDKITHHLSHVSFEYNASFLTKINVPVSRKTYPSFAATNNCVFNIAKIAFVNLVKAVSSIRLCPHKISSAHRCRPLLAFFSTTESPSRLRTMATLGVHERRHKVTIVGSGNW